MSTSLDQFAHRVLSGAERGPRAAALRAALSSLEPFYAAAMIARNGLYDAGAFRSRRLPQPVVSVGNITSGGTGKTPVIRWLATRLREGGRQVAVLSRGYKSAPGALGDEQVMLDRCLNEAHETKVLIRAGPDRFAGGRQALREHPTTDVFLLDDGFQHRRLARDFDLVLINATHPFGHGHVLPRGLLREPMRGLSRAHAVLVTHADQVDGNALDAVDREVRRRNSGVALYRAVHAHTGLRTALSPTSGPPDQPLDALRDRRWFAFCGIGSPQTFLRQLQSIGGRAAGHQFFPDHHPYTASEVIDLQQRAARAGADVLVTTEKDWAKLSDLPPARGGTPPVWRVEMAVRFHPNGEARLLEQVWGVLHGR